MKLSKLVKYFLVTLLALALSISAAASAQAPEASDADSSAWPREWKGSDATLVMYEPQVESWKDYLEIKIRVAIAIEIPTDPEPWFASVVVRGKTTTEMEDRKVIIYDLETHEIKWQAGARTPKNVQDYYTELMPLDSIEVALDRILAHLDAPQSDQYRQAPKLKFDVPTIIVSEKPSILVPIDGEPEVHKLEDSPVMQVVNTEWDIFFDAEETRYLLRDENCWYQTKDLTKGEWTFLGVLPPTFFELPDVERFNGVYESTEKQCTETEVPEIYVTKGEAVLVASEGKMNYVPIKGTELLYGNNTDSDVFMYQGNSWLLLSGRWFKAPSLKGPWSSEPTPPKEFAKIPDNHEKAGVLASVPGTREAIEASIAAEIPQQSQVTRDTTVNITYVGAPTWAPIDGTAVQYATNTSYDVFLVKGRYWACVDGIWFVGNNPNGPLAVADKVDAALYKIPASSPKYNVTYVKVYNATPTYVVVGYTAPYYGVYAYNGVVVYGTGYHYHYPWRVYAHSSWHYHYHHGYPYHYPVHYRRTYAHARYHAAHRAYHRYPSSRYHRPGNGYRGRPVHYPASARHSSWNRGSVSTRTRATRVSHTSSTRNVRKSTYRKTGNNHYAGKDGRVYNNKGGKYQPSSTRNRSSRQPSKQTRNSLNQTSQSRSRGGQKSSQYRSYQNSQPRREQNSGTSRDSKNSKSSKKSSTSKSKKSKRSSGSRGRRSGGRRR